MSHSKRVVVAITEFLYLAEALRIARGLKKDGLVGDSEIILWRKQYASTGKFQYAVCRIRRDRSEVIEGHTFSVPRSHLFMPTKNLAAIEMSEKDLRGYEV